MKGFYFIIYFLFFLGGGGGNCKAVVKRTGFYRNRHVSQCVRKVQDSPSSPYKIWRERENAFLMLKWWVVRCRTSHKRNEVFLNGLLFKIFTCHYLVSLEDPFHRHWSWKEVRGALHVQNNFENHFFVTPVAPVV